MENSTLEPILIESKGDITKGWIKREKQPDGVALGVGAPIGDPVLTSIRDANERKRKVEHTPDVAAFYRSQESGLYDAF